MFFGLEGKKKEGSDTTLGLPEEGAAVSTLHQALFPKEVFERSVRCRLRSCLDGHRTRYQHSVQEAP